MDETMNESSRLRLAAIFLLFGIAGALRLLHALYFNFDIGANLISMSQAESYEKSCIFIPSGICLFLGMLLAVLEWAVSEPGRATVRGRVLLFCCLVFTLLLTVVWTPASRIERRAKLAERWAAFDQDVATNFMALEDGRLGLEYQSMLHEAASFEKGDQRLAAETLGRWGLKLFENLAKYAKARSQFLPDAYLFHGDLKNEQQIEGRISAIREFSAEGQSINAWLKSEDYRTDMQQSQVGNASIEKVAARFRETLQPKWDSFTACTQAELAVASNAVAILELSKQHLGHWTAKPDDHDPVFEDPAVERTFKDFRDAEIDLENSMYAAESKLALGDRFRDPRPAARRQKNAGESVAATTSVASASQAIKRAQGRFISALGRKDMVYDAGRNILYITEGANVLRYDLGSNAFLPPFACGGSLCGIDLSNDGNLLAVADTAGSGAEGWIELIDLRASNISKVRFGTGGGTFSAAFGADGAVLVTSTAQWGPLLRYDPATRTSSEIKIPDIRQITGNTMLAASFDRRPIAYAQAGISSGAFGKYDVLSRMVVPGRGTGAFNYEVGISRDGSQMALPLFSGTMIIGSDPRTIGNTMASPVGVVYHPTRDVVFFSWRGSSQVRAFATGSYEQVAEFETGEDFGWNGVHAFVQGRLRISPDGSLLFCTVNDGVRCFETKMGEVATLAKGETKSPIISNPPPVIKTGTITITPSRNVP